MFYLVSFCIFLYLFFWKFWKYFLKILKKYFWKFWIFEKNYSLKPSLAYLLSYCIFSFLIFLAVWEEIGDKKPCPDRPDPPFSGIKYMSNEGTWVWVPRQWKWTASESRSLASLATKNLRMSKLTFYLNPLNLGRLGGYLR